VARILVTGASGLIGRRVVERWPASLDLLTLAHDDLDLRNARAFSSAIEQIRPDALLHLAWSASGDPEYRDSADNDRWLASSLAAARTCRRLGARFIGTGTVIDDQPDANRYAHAKHQLWTELRGEIETGAVTWLRPFHVFDHECGRPALVAAVNAAKIEGRPVILRTPDSRHDFILATDVGEAIVATLQAGLTGCVEIGTGTARSVSELVEALGASWRRALQVETEDVDDRVADTRALRLTGWAAVRTERIFAHA
jgi:nucleoside-diphosphate-sugar epimerase